MLEIDWIHKRYTMWHRCELFIFATCFSFEEPLSVLMLCMPSNHLWPFLYHTKMTDFEYFRVLSVFV